MGKKSSRENPEFNPNPGSFHTNAPEAAKAAQKDFWHEVIPRQNRRASFLDYKSPRIYMLTLFKAPKAPSFSRIFIKGYSGNTKAFKPQQDSFSNRNAIESKHQQDSLSSRDDSGAQQGSLFIEPMLELTEAGEIIHDELKKTSTFRKGQMHIINFVIMPDHVHVLVNVFKPLEKSVISIFAMTEAAITGRCRGEGIINPEASIFKGKGIHDRIVSSRNQVSILNNYISDNPRRYIIKKTHPNHFTAHHGITISGHKFDFFGNIYLLKLPLRKVHVRRSWTSEQIEDYIATTLKCAVHGEVLISPYIHPKEKEIMRSAIDLGASLIRITEEEFTERWKPSGREFELCSEGRLLIIRETEAEQMKDMSYRRAKHMNNIAEFLTSIPVAQNHGTLRIQKNRE